ncbi:MAG: acyltransferase family protein [Clostridiales bacterium]|nr:acyltransferase family protein [Clostridiales bacterium]
MTLNFYNCITRFCVPVFFMISGALFLGGRERSIKEMYTRNIPRTAVMYIVWSLIFSVFDTLIIKGTGDGALKEIFELFISGKYHLWFLLTLIGLYMVTPLLYKIVNNNKTLCLYFLCLYFIFILLVPYILGYYELPYYRYIKLLLLKISPEVVGTYCGYYVLGYYLHKFLDVTKPVAVGFFAASLGFMVLTIIRNAAESADKGHVASYCGYGSLPVFLFSAAIFMLCKTFLRDMKVPGISRAAGFTLGIYLVHPLFISISRDILGISALIFNPWVSVPLLSLSILLCSIALSAILAKVPGIRKTLG